MFLSSAQYAVLVGCSCLMPDIDAVFGSVEVKRLNIVCFVKSLYFMNGPGADNINFDIIWPIMYWWNIKCFRTRACIAAQTEKAKHQRKEIFQPCKAAGSPWLQAWIFEDSSWKAPTWIVFTWTERSPISVLWGEVGGSKTARVEELPQV